MSLEALEARASVMEDVSGRVQRQGCHRFPARHGPGPVGPPAHRHGGSKHGSEGGQVGHAEKDATFGCSPHQPDPAVDSQICVIIRTVTSLIDAVAGFALKMRGGSAAIFPRGWGDRTSLELFDHLPVQDDIAAAEIVWDAKTEHRGFRTRKGLFKSPLASRLPDNAGLVPVELIEPGTGTDRAVVLMPAWNDEGFERRRKIALPLLQRGVASVMFEIPLYGSRRGGVGDDIAIGSVSDFALMGAGALSEAHALLNGLERSYGWLGVGGFSMGGNLAALVSAGRRLGVATGLMAASHSPGPVYLDGVLSGAIDFPALGPGGGAELRRVLSSVTVTSQPPRPHHRAAVLVAARGDGFVPGQAVLAVAAHWPGSELRWLPGGHGGLWWRHREALVSAISDSFDRMVSGDR